MPQRNARRLRDDEYINDQPLQQVRPDLSYTPHSATGSPQNTQRRTTPSSSPSRQSQQVTYQSQARRSDPGQAVNTRQKATGRARKSDGQTNQRKLLVQYGEHVQEVQNFNVRRNSSISGRESGNTFQSATSGEAELQYPYESPGHDTYSSFASSSNFQTPLNSTHRQINPHQGKGIEQPENITAANVFLSSPYQAYQPAPGATPPKPKTLRPTTPQLPQADSPQHVPQSPSWAEVQALPVHASVPPIDSPEYYSPAQRLQPTTPRPTHPTHPLSHAPAQRENPCNAPDVQHSAAVAGNHAPRGKVARAQARGVISMVQHGDEQDIAGAQQGTHGQQSRACSPWLPMGVEQSKLVRGVEQGRHMVADQETHVVADQDSHLLVEQEQARSGKHGAQQINSNTGTSYAAHTERVRPLQVAQDESSTIAASSSSDTLDQSSSNNTISSKPLVHPPPQRTPPLPPTPPAPTAPPTPASPSAAAQCPANTALKTRLKRNTQPQRSQKRRRSRG